MISFLLAFLPFAVCMLLARFVSGGRRPKRAPMAAAEPGPSNHVRPTVAPAAVGPDDEAAADETTPSAWTALDDVQLDRLLKEASS